MLDFWIRIVFYLIGIGTIALIFSWIGGPKSGWLSAILLLAWWVIYQLYYLQKTIRWLEDFRLEKVPHGSGTWDLVFAKIYRLAKSGEHQRQQLAEALKNFRNATEAMPDGVVTLDEDNQVIYANEQAEDQLGINSRQDAGRNLINIVRHPDFVSYLNGREWDKPIVLKGLRKRDQVLQMQLIPYGSQQRLLLTRDITQLDRLETTRRDFVANVSHELKTPLTVLRGFLETLRELPLSNEQRDQYLGLMHGQARRMESIVEDLLVLSKLESTSAPAQDDALSMASMLDELVHDGQTLSRDEHAIECQTTTDAKLLGSEEELRSAFSNLVSNAVRYTPSGGKIHIEWSVNDEGQGVFSVSDTGPGIASQHLPRLTERFYRVDRGRSREAGGTGLGLAIVKHVATRHQAQLLIKSEVGKGSRFSIIFPAKRIEA
jgi:two-component system phosphate regulon sensor histidine kinase PhoR